MHPPSRFSSWPCSPRFRRPRRVRRPSARPRATGPVALPLGLPGEVHDERIPDQLDAAAERLMNAGQTVKMSELRVFSHPDDHFFALSEGMVSRYVALPVEKAPGEVTFMAVTADFGAGSSGAPVFNERGGVVGLVNNTQSLYYDPKKGRDLQMVFKHCLPSQYIQQLIRKP